VVLDCPNPEALATFYEQLIDPAGHPFCLLQAGGG
jgi:hypothetical protein